MSECGEREATAWRAMFCILLAMSSVRSAVEPPAPQVMSQNMGCGDVAGGTVSRH